MNEKLLALFKTLEETQKTIQHILPTIYDTQASQLQTQLINHLGEHEDQTVPQIALFRKSSRQNIQVVINELLTLGIVIKKFNPHHKRSVIYKLSSIGYDIFQHNKKAHDSFLEAFQELFTPEELDQTEKILNKLNEALKK